MRHEITVKQIQALPKVAFSIFTANFAAVWKYLQTDGSPSRVGLLSAKH